MNLQEFSVAWRNYSVSLFDMAKFEPGPSSPSACQYACQRNRDEVSPPGGFHGSLPFVIVGLAMPSKRAPRD
jgi:hypothetical protein